MDEPKPHPAYDFFVPGPLPGYASNPNNNNWCIEVDVPLLGKQGAVADEPMVGPLVGEIAEPIMEMEEQDEEEVKEANKEWLMAPVTPPPMPVVPPLRTYKVGVIEDLSTCIGNLEYRHGKLMKKVIQVSDAEVADGYDVLDGSGRGQIGTGRYLGGAGSAGYDPTRRGNYRIKPTSAGITGRCTAERGADLAVADYGF
ncbi:hypothetical protein Tco_1565519 [Tanacetum coccineum]